MMFVVTDTRPVNLLTPQKGRLRLQHISSIPSVRDSGEQMENTRSQLHSNCFVCEPSNDDGLGVVFEPISDGGVQADLLISTQWEGYPEHIHGGIVASLLDGAMTHCLFRKGRRGVTAELTVRYLHPVKPGTPTTVKAYIESEIHPLYILKSDLIQGGKVKARARAKFMVGA